jgi:predicted metal-binding transcription factor (methanogenesis marker protein 9)
VQDKNDCAKSDKFCPILDGTLSDFEMATTRLMILKFILHKKFDPSGNGPKEGLGLVCRWQGNNHFINMLSSFFII